jgi:UDP-2,3-diacylglucosamine hydrolase
MKAVFLSDAHLCDSEDAGYKNLLDFFNSLENDIDNLFIVGDFFDFWFCTNNKVFPGFRVIVDKLLELHDKGLNIFLFEGNHDFFLDDYFSRYGITVYPDEAEVYMDGRKLFIAHGDLIDTSNARYLFLRKLLRSRVFYLFQRALPCSILWKISRISSHISKEHLAKPPDVMTDRMNAFSEVKFRDGFDAVILGHCHRPQLKQSSVNGSIRTFVTLGDWISHFSYLSYDNGEFRMKCYSLPV